MEGGGRGRRVGGGRGRRRVHIKYSWRKNWRRMEKQERKGRRKSEHRSGQGEGFKEGGKKRMLIKVMNKSYLISSIELKLLNTHTNNTNTIPKKWIKMLLYHLLVLVCGSLVQGRI